MDQRIVDYIKKSRELGHGDEDIKTLLLNAGHREEDVRAAFDAADGKNVMPLPPPPSPPIYPSSVSSSGGKIIRQIYCTGNNTCNLIPLEPRKIVKKSIGSVYFFILYIMFFSVIFAVGFEFDLSWLSLLFGSLTFWIYIAGFIGITLFKPIYEFFYFRYYFYDLTDKHVIIKKGVVARNEATISYDRIQNVFVDQDFWDRIFRLYDVHIATADYQSARIAHIDGVSEENSEKLKALLLENVEKAGSKPV